MATVIANLSMSLDGFIADPDDGVEELFGWYADGPVAVEDLVPVVLGHGIPFLAGVASAPVRFEDPEVIEAPGVTHLRYRVRRGG